MRSIKSPKGALRAIRAGKSDLMNASSTVTKEPPVAAATECPRFAVGELPQTAIKLDRRGQPADTRKPLKVRIRLTVF